MEFKRVFLANLETPSSILLIKNKKAYIFYELNPIRPLFPRWANAWLEPWAGRFLGEKDAQTEAQPAGNTTKALSMLRNKQNETKQNKHNWTM